MPNKRHFFPGEVRQQPAGLRKFPPTPDPLPAVKLSQVAPIRRENLYPQGIRHPHLGRSIRPGDYGSRGSIDYGRRG